MYPILQILAQVPIDGTNASAISAPIIVTPWLRIAVIAAAYVVTLGLSGRIVMYFIGPIAPPAHDTTDGARRTRFDPGMIIGKCENIIALTFVLTGEESGLAIIFAAKSLVRGTEKNGRQDYYLSGTLVNLVWALLVAYVTRILIKGV